LRNIQNSHPKKQLKEPITELRYWHFRIFETTSIPLPPNSPKKAQRGHSPHLLYYVITTLTIPARKEIPHPAIHDPHHAKEMKKTTPKSTSNLTMKKKMIDGLIALLVHTTPIHHNHSSLLKIIQSENPSKSSRPHKKTHFEWNFDLPNALPRERQPSPLEPSRRRGEHIKKGTNLKNLLLGWNLANPVHPPPPPPCVDETQWNVIFSKEIHDWEVDVVTAFFQKLQTISIRMGSQDKLWWIPSKKCIFKVKDFFGASSIAEGSSFPWKSVWRTKSPPRAAFFVWSATLGKILTLDNLRNRQVVVINRCFMCKKDGESVDHLLLHCEVAHAL
jgi:hypothetical protein